MAGKEKKGKKPPLIGKSGKLLKEEGD